MPKVYGWFTNPPDLPWERERVSFLYDSREGPEYFSFPMTGLVPYNEPDPKELEMGPSPMWIAYLDPRGSLGKVDTMGDKTYVIDLPDTFEKYFEKLPYDHRKELRYNYRKNSDILVEENRKEDINLLWDDYIAKVLARCKEEGETPFSMEGIELLKRLFQDSMTYVLSFRMNGELYAVNISYRKNGVVYDSTCIRTRVEEVKSRGLGNFAVLKNIEYAIRDGYKEYDMLTGDWGYKHKFDAKPRSLKHYIKCSHEFARQYEIPFEEISVLLDT